MRAAETGRGPVHPAPLPLAPARARPRGLGGRQARLAWLMVAPLVLYLAALTLYPFGYMVVMAFFDYDLASWQPPSFIGLDNFRAALADRTAAVSWRFTLVLAVSAVSLEMVLGVLLAMLVLDAKGERWLRSAFLVPMAVPPVVAGVAWKMLYNYQYGPLNWLLSLVGISRVSWLGDPFWAGVGVVIADVWQWTPFVFLVVYAGLQSVPDELIEAARVDGASGAQLLWHVRMPLVRPLMWIVLILRLIDVIKLFDIIYMVTFGGPGSATHSISYYIYKVGLSYGWDIGYASALSLLLLLVVSVLVNLLIRGLRLRELLGF